MLALFSGMAFEMAAIIGTGVWVGYQLDKKWQTGGPWFTAGLGLLSVFLALYYPISRLIKWNEKK